MSYITTYPNILLKKCADGKADWWEVTVRVKVRCELSPMGRIFIPDGFVSDFASTPRAFWWLVPPHGRTANACIVHDYLYEKKPLKASRKEVDLFWRELLKQCNVPAWQVWIMYKYVRLLGGFNWKKLK
ncbi:DUF1353 domain-containing protein [Runella salmonicolor]|uniref:DUF1353 domain-containing protein n=1 Tax=Runella salmonicolor TaxID=2950278 RepID=A0ABT1FRX7_9BACT|nr:DUF1353 domain-containing protein [Runella salmonicolor]MCP1384461.1 DUF1353 domain-containing protein [Runella salmonicolor]